MIMDTVENVENNELDNLSYLPFWDNLTAGEKTIVSEKSVLRKFKKNQLINSSDTSCMGMLFIIDGGIRVSMISDEGREVTLYRIQRGDCCVTTASCVIKQITFDTVVTASDDSTLLIIPASLCAMLSESNIYFKAFMYETETERFSQVIWVMQQMLFKRLNQRLATYLVNEYENSGSEKIELTQEEIARDINSAREVVARMMKLFSDEGLIEVGRGFIRIIDIQKLKEMQ